MKGILVPEKGIVKPFLRRNGFKAISNFGSFASYMSPLLEDMVVVTGASGESTLTATERLISEYAPNFVISIGFGTSLDFSVSVGSVILCEEIISLNGPMALWSKGSGSPIDVPSSRSLQALFDNLNHDDNKRSYPRGRAVSAPEFVTNKNMKLWLGEEFDSLLIERDGTLVAEACNRYGVPFAILRSINNPRSNTVSTFSGRLESMTRSQRIKAALLPQNVMPYLIFLSRRRRAKRKIEQVISRLHSLVLP